MTDVPSDEVLPCGCIVRCAIVDGMKTVYLIACRTTCQFFLDAVAVAMQEGKTIQYRQAP